MIETAQLRLRAWRSDDLPALTRLRNDVALQAQLLARVRGNSSAQVQQWLQDRSAAAGWVLWILADRHTDQALGFVQFTGMDGVDRRAELGICLLCEAQGGGRGREALAAALPYLQSNWDLRKVSLKVRQDNAGAIRCYEHLGFERCGLLREDVFLEGRWQDIVLMEKLLSPTLPSATPTR